MVATVERPTATQAQPRATRIDSKDWDKYYAGSRKRVEAKRRVVIAGGGIGGLCAALVLKNAGHDVQVFEKAKEFRPFGGPIQIATNALESLRKIDRGVYTEILDKANVIGDRVNGLKDGISEEWYATFDLLSPAVKRKQAPSVVIDRPILQEILLSRVNDRVTIGAEVVGYEQLPHNNGVIASLANGSKYEADMLIGSDGIRSKVREQFYGKPVEPIWSGYTCFAAIANCVPDDIKDVGYKVFLGSRKYFVSVDVGGGRIQWYAFLNIPPNTLNFSNSAESLQWLKESEFNEWGKEVHQLLDCTPADQIEQRDLFDHKPDLTWAKGNVCLLGDSVHAMMPNLGQGGGMAIEDALSLGQALLKAELLDAPLDFALERYGDTRSWRAAAVQGLSRFSSAILFQYNRPLAIDFSSFPPELKNCGPRSMITRACQGFLQHVAFPLQFDYLFGYKSYLWSSTIDGTGAIAHDFKILPFHEFGNKHLWGANRDMWESL
jgi:zeaxanthin epoxidase